MDPNPSVIKINRCGKGWMSNLDKGLESFQTHESGMLNPINNY